MTYWCRNCEQAVTDIDIVTHEVYEDGFLNPYETTDSCPYCGEELTLEEAVECPICGEWMCEDDYICHDCVDEIARYVKDMLRDYAFAHDMCESEAKEYFNLWLDQKGEI